MLLEIPPLPPHDNRCVIVDVFTRNTHVLDFSFASEVVSLIMWRGSSSELPIRQRYAEPPFKVCNYYFHVIRKINHEVSGEDVCIVSTHISYFMGLVQEGGPNV